MYCMHITYSNYMYTYVCNDYNTDDATLPAVLHTLDYTCALHIHITLHIRITCTLHITCPTMLHKYHIFV